MTTNRANSLRIGDHLEFDGQTYVFAALVNGEVAELLASGEPTVRILISALLTDPTFKPVPDRGRRRGSLRESAIFTALPAMVKARAYWLERRITEVLDGLPADVSTGARPRREYDVTSRSMRQRLLAKEEELKTLGESLNLTTLKRLAAAYEAEGIQGLVDQRLIRRTAMGGQVDQRVIDALLPQLRLNIDRSSRSMDLIRRYVEQRVRADHGDEVPFPSRVTFHRLVTKLAQGRHATGSARTRRTLSQQPATPFSELHPVRPGELMQIDSTPLDIAVEFEDGIIGRVQRTAIVEVAARSIPAAILRPTTKTADAALLLARASPRKSCARAGQKQSRWQPRHCPLRRCDPSMTC